MAIGSALLCGLAGTVTIVGNLITPIPTYKEVANPNYGNCPKKSDPFTLDDLICKDKTIKKWSGPFPPKVSEGIGLYLSGLGVSVIFAILLFIIKGRWIWFPWQHDKD